MADSQIPELAIAATSGEKQRSSQPTFYRPQLDWLRFLAFASVFAHHALPSGIGPYLKLGMSRPFATWVVAAIYSGAYGVDLFFALSAFLITELLIREHARFGKIATGAFYMRRILRIWPLYYTFLILTAFVFPLYLPGALRGAFLAAFSLFAGNWICAARGYPGTVADPLWSVSIEEQFYISWPLIFSAIGPARIRPLAISLLILGTATRIALVHAGVGHPAIWCNTFARVDPIALGALLAGSYVGLLPEFRRVRLPTAFLAWITLVCCGRFGAMEGPRALITYPAAAAACALLVIVFLSAPAANNAATRSLAYLGKISYGLYVFHVLALDLARKLFGSSPAYLVVGAALTFALASASYYFLEFPFLRLKRHFTRIQSRPEPSSF
jgi:peptidoglycan/LPS O-acetylase OafA/YrhL